MFFTSLSLGVLARPIRSAQQNKNGYHVHKRNKGQKHVTGQTFTKNFKTWTHEENEFVNIDEVAERKQSRRQRYAALGRASFFFLTEHGEKGEVCLSVVVPEDRIIHIAYHIPELIEIGQPAQSDETKILISVQEHMLGEDNDDNRYDDQMDDDRWGLKDGSFPVESFKIFRKSGTIHHETDMGGSVEVCVTAPDLKPTGGRNRRVPESYLPMLIGVDITTGKEHFDDEHEDLEDDMDDALDQLEECISKSRGLVNLVKRSKQVESINYSDLLRLNKSVVRWPVIQILVLLATGFLWMVSITKYLNKKLFI